MPPRRRYKDAPAPAAKLVRKYRGPAGSAPASDADAALDAVQRHWIEVAGEAVAAKARPVRRAKSGAVTVACADAIWAQTLSSQADDLADRLRAVVGDDAFSSLRFVPDEHALRRLAEATAPPSAPPPVPAEKMAAAKRLAEGVADPVLRDLVARAAARAPTRSERSKLP